MATVDINSGNEQVELNLLCLLYILYRDGPFVAYREYEAANGRMIRINAHRELLEASGFFPEESGRGQHYVNGAEREGYIEVERPSPRVITEVRITKKGERRMEAALQALGMSKQAVTAEVKKRLDDGFQPAWTKGGSKKSAPKKKEPQAIEPMDELTDEEWENFEEAISPAEEMADPKVVEAVGQWLLTEFLETIAGKTDVHLEGLAEEHQMLLGRYKELEDQYDKLAKDYEGNLKALRELETNFANAEGNIERLMKSLEASEREKNLLMSERRNRFKKGGAKFYETLSPEARDTWDKLMRQPPSSN